MAHQDYEHGHRELEIEALEETLDRPVNSGAYGDSLGFLDCGFDTLLELCKNILKLLLGTGLQVVCVS